MKKRQPLFWLTGICSAAAFFNPQFDLFFLAAFGALMFFSSIDPEVAIPCWERHETHVTFVQWLPFIAALLFVVLMMLQTTLILYNKQTVSSVDDIVRTLKSMAAIVVPYVIGLVYKNIYVLKRS